MPAIVAAEVLTALLTAPLVLAPRFAPPLQQQIVVGFNLGLPLLALIWMLAPGGAQPGNGAAARGLRGLGLLAFAMHAASVADLVTAAGGGGLAGAWQALVAVAANATAKVQPANFMLFDFIGVFASALIFVLAEEGAAAALQTALLAPVVGPGAAIARVLAKREERLEAGAAKRPPAATAAARAKRE